MRNLVRYIPLRKADYKHRHYSDENLRKTSDNRKISQFWKSPTISNVQTFQVFNFSSVYSPATPIESSTAIAVEMQECTEQIYPSIQTLPDNAPNTVSPA